MGPPHTDTRNTQHTLTQYTLYINDCCPPCHPTSPSSSSPAVQATSARTLPSAASSPESTEWPSSRPSPTPFPRRSTVSPRSPSTSFPRTLQRRTRLILRSSASTATSRRQRMSRPSLTTTRTRAQRSGVSFTSLLSRLSESRERSPSSTTRTTSRPLSACLTLCARTTATASSSSSATVYGAPKTIPIPETSPLVAESVYGRTKVMGEWIIKDVCDADPKWRAIGLRYFNPAGAHPSGLIGEDPRGKPGNLVPLLAQMAVGKFAKEGLKIFGNDYPTPDGTCVRDYIHVMDLAEGHILMLSALEKDEIYANLEKSAFGGSGGKYKAYNLGKGKGMSVLNMVEAMRKASGFEYKYEIVGRRTGDVPDLTADPATAEKELGFKASRSLEEMCRDQWNWQSKNPQGYGGQ